MTSSAVVLRRARVSAGLTQRALASRSGSPQASIARTESSVRDVACDTLDRWLRSTGHRLCALPTLGTTAAETADVIERELAAGRFDSAFRAVIQLADDLKREVGAVRVAVVTAPPGSTGDARFDALLAGVVAVRLDEQSLPHPAWVNDVTSLSERWFVDYLSEQNDDTVAATPRQLLRLGVVLEACELESI